MSRPPGTPAAQRRTGRPPVLSFLAVVAVLAVTLVSFWFGARAEIGIANTGREVDFNTLGYVVGCFASILALYLFLRSDREARSTLRYNDWRPSAAKLVGWTTVCSWAAGAAHLWFWAQDLTRP